VTVQNAEIADQFEHLADLLELDGANPFRVRAYRNAARFIRGHGRSLAELVEEGADLAGLPGIGEDLAGKIATLVRTGRLPLLEQLAARVPAPLVAMTRVPGLGPKRARALYRALRVRSLEDLARRGAQRPHPRAARFRSADRATDRRGRRPRRNRRVAAAPRRCEPIARGWSSSCAQSTAYARSRSPAASVGDARRWATWTYW